jgi:beta-lactamase regulating signal transducer with metallopeptidase domain
LCTPPLWALAGAPAPAVLAAGVSSGGALHKLTEGSSETATTASTATTATTETTSTSQPGNSHTTILLVLAAAVLVLVGIAFVIVRDARRVAPAGDGELVEGSTPRHSEAALRKRRAKAKAARMQRKRNR